MKKLLFGFLLLPFFVIAQQEINCKINDASTGQPLPYATIFCERTKEVMYADSSGDFSFDKTLFSSKDSLRVQYLGYNNFLIAIDELHKENILKLTPASSELAPITISNCKHFKEYDINKKTGSINSYLGPGPEIKIIIIGRYLNTKNKGGYVKKIEFYDGIFNSQIKVPVRLHWYEWNAETNMPGVEITKQNIILYPYKKGWNSFTIPENNIYFSSKDIVLGLEFIYPVEYEKQFHSITDIQQKAQWLMDMNHRWSLGMQTSKNENERGFYAINNGLMQGYSIRKNDLYIKPAVKFTVSVCEQ